MPLPNAMPLTDSQRRAVAALLREVAPVADELGRLFAAHGHELALVGGSVRDVFLARKSEDLDLTTDAPPERVMEITAGWADKIWPIGIEFGTVGLRKAGCTLEITTYRSDSYGPKSRKPAVRYGTSLEEDLARRDFTINAMAARLPDHLLVDPFGGLRDLKERVLRTPSSPESSFDDDPLRMLRAARFAAQLGFSVVPEVREAMKGMAGRISPALGKVSAERIRAELAKLMVAPDPRTGIELLVDTGLAEYILPEVPKLKLETDEHHHHKDVYEHSLTVLTQATELEQRYGLSSDLVVRLAALLHDIGKPKTRTLLPGGRVAFHHHEVVGAAMTRSRLRELRFPKAVVEDVAKLVELHLRFHGYGTGEWTDAAVRRYVRDAGPLLQRLHVLTRADCTTRNKARAARLASAYDALEQRIARLAKEEEIARIRPDLDGNEIMRILGLRSGPAVGAAYKFLLGLRMEHGPLGRERATAELLRWATDQGLAPPGAGQNPGS
ncbi:MAG TPA: CCA tRNA nucleotidyltransferase [Streptosporangiaceae bacterium]|nr:CCA tRNA nucleotidyltransferase [Streptosporangiaceae bacterium]